MRPSDILALDFCDYNPRFCPSELRFVHKIPASLRGNVCGRHVGLYATKPSANPTVAPHGVAVMIAALVVMLELRFKLQRDRGG